MRSVPLWKTLTIVLVSIWSLLYSLPSFMGGAPAWWPSWLPSQVVHRGLDLQGGLHLLLHVEGDKAVEQTVENLVDEIRGVLREEKRRSRGVERVGRDTLTIKLSDLNDGAPVAELVRQKFPNHKVDANTSGEVRVSLSEAEQKSVRTFAVEQSIQTIRSRIDAFGVSEPTIQKQGEDRILVQLPGMQDSARAKALIGRTARLEFKMVDEKGDLEAALAGRIPPGDVVLYGERKDKATGQKSREPYLLKKRTVISGDLLSDARVSIDNQYGESYVSVTFNSQGGRKFAQLTGESVGQRMAIVLDNAVYSAPVIQEKIEGGRARITGSFTPEEAHDLAIVLRAGALPAPVSIMEERTVGPTLGSDSIRQGLFAMVVGGGLVLAFMVMYYHGFGLLANTAVVVNVLILMAVLAMMQATLTMPGIAGAVLLVGMSVDANVLIYERIREELRLGKTPLAAIDHGYDRAFMTIMDSHVTTLVTALILFQFGTGPVRGFAVTLSIGLVASLFTAVFMTRVMVGLILRNRRPKTLSI